VHTVPGDDAWPAAAWVPGNGRQPFLFGWTVLSAKTDKKTPGGGAWRN